MSNNAPDYDNLYFEPIGDMSKLNECNDGKRGSDVLMLTLEKCQKIVARNVELEKKLKIAEEALIFYALKKHFEDAYIINIYGDCDEVDGCNENGLKAREALAKIRNN